MTRFSILFIANHSEKIVHLKLQPRFNESKYQAHILPMKYDTKRCQDYPVCLTLFLRHTTRGTLSRHVYSHNVSEPFHI